MMFSNFNYTLRQLLTISGILSANVDFHIYLLITYLKSCCSASVIKSRVYFKV